jgi:hypothetical protein
MNKKHKQANKTGREQRRNFPPSIVQSSSFRIEKRKISRQYCNFFYAERQTLATKESALICSMTIDKYISIITRYRDKILMYHETTNKVVERCFTYAESSLFDSSSFGLAGDGELSTPISALRSLMLCSNSFMRLPISSSAMKSRRT